MHVARVYLRVSTQGQDLGRQESIIAEARDTGYYIAGVYREKASGARADRPELLRLIADLQPGEVVVAEKIDRISRLPLPEAEKLIQTIRNKGARLAVPGVVDLSDIAASADGVAKIVLESIQEMLLKLALQMARDDFEDRRERQRQGIELAKAGGKHAGRQADLVSKTVCPPLPMRWLALHCASEGCSDGPSRSSPQEDEPWRIIEKHLSESMLRSLRMLLRLRRQAGKERFGSSVRSTRRRPACGGS